LPENDAVRKLSILAKGIGSKYELLMLRSNPLLEPGLNTNDSK
jgi:hypothetical protein